MLLMILKLVYGLLAIAMIAMVLMQRGAGAQAGSGFGGGASATVFGSRGASNFLSKSTKWLAIAFFGISLFMAWYATHKAVPAPTQQQDLGVMAQVPATPQQAPAGSSTVPAAPLPQSAMPQSNAPASTVPSAPTQQQTQPVAPAQTAPQAPTPPASGG